MAAYCFDVVLTKQKEPQQVLANSSCNTFQCLLGEIPHKCSRGVQTFYDLQLQDKALGEGSSSKVVECTKRRRNEKFACKILKKSYNNIELMLNEVKFLRYLQNAPGIIKFFDNCEDQTHVYIITELCSGRSLHKSTLEQVDHHFEEQKAANLMYQIITILRLCKVLGIIHGDIKPGNFVFTTPQRVYFETY